MAIDPNIVFRGQVQPFDPIENYARLQAIKSQQLQQQAQQIKLLDLAKQQEVQNAVTDAAQQSQGDSQKFLDILGRGPAASLVPQFQQQQVEMQTKKAQALKVQSDLLGNVLDVFRGVKDQQSYDQARAFAKSMGVDVSQIGLSDAYDPGKVQAAQNYGVSYKDQLDNQLKQLNLQQSQVEAPIKQRKLAAEALTAEQQAKQGPAITEPTLAMQAAQGNTNAAQALKLLTQQKIAARPVNNVMTGDDVQQIATGIANGDQPPTLTGLYRNAGPVRAELERRRVPIAKMEMDWKATQRYVNSLNGPQQIRLRQSIQSAGELLDKLDGLYSEWKSLAPVSGFKLANHAALVAMKNLPGRPGAVANALDTQISELTADLGNIYMGGNSPTDQALKLGAKAISSDWGPEAFEEAIKQARLNVGIRANSIKFAEPAGMSGTTDYFHGTTTGQTTEPPANNNDPLNIR